MKSKNKRFFSHVLSCVVASSFCLISSSNTYYNVPSISAADVIVSDNYVLQANEILLDVRNSDIDGEIFETNEIAEIKAGIMEELSDDTDLLDKVDVNINEYVITYDVFSNSSFSAESSLVNITANIVAENDISFNSNSFIGDTETIIYSKKGNISIDSLSLKFNGIIYAPYGTIHINSRDIKIAGAVIAKKIIIEGENAQIYSTEETTTKLDELEYVCNDKILDPISFYNHENEKITFMLGRYNQLYTKKIYARYDENDFVLVDESSENTFNLDTNDFSDTVDYYVIATDKFGNEIKSMISSFKKEADEINKVVIDTDIDGIPDAYEVIIGTDSYVEDSDGDGYNDGYEILTLYTDPLIPDSDSDFDNDGLTNYAEMQLGTNPYLKDSDFDGVNDVDDSLPLEPLDGIQLTVSEEIPVKAGEFDIVNRFVNKNGERCESVYNWLTDYIKLMSIDNKRTYGIFDAKHRCTAMVTATPSMSIVDAYNYDGDKLKSVSHNGNKYEYTYDENNNLINVSINDYELLNNYYTDTFLTSDHSEEGDIEYIYDYDGRVAKIKVNGEDAYTMNYDENGSLMLLCDYIDNTTYEYCYNTTGRESVLKSVMTNKGFGYEYSNDKNSCSVVYTDNGVVKCQNTVVTGDVFNRKYKTDTSLITGNSSIKTVVDGYEHFSQNVSVNDTNILSSDWYNSEYGTEKILYHDGKQIKYEYDKNADISGIYENDERRSTYEYDDLNRLTRENNIVADKTYVYSYDKYGNILSVNEYDYTEGELGEAKNVISYAYSNSAWNDLLTEYDGQEFTYDGGGKPLSYRDDYVLGWETNQKLKTVTKGNSKIVYTYNIDGIRTSKSVNDIITYYNYEDNKLINLKTNDDTVWFIYDDNNSVVGMEYSDLSYYFEKNAQGDIERIFNSNGDYVCSYCYDAFGNILSVRGNDEIAKLNPFRYRSYFYDEETGFYNLNARYYDPVVRRFINPDDVEYIGSKGSAASYNIFAYCENNPVMNSDPSGNVFTFNSNLVVSGNFESSPLYSPTSWNGTRKNKANCYCYAMNMYANDPNWGPNLYVAVDPGDISGTNFIYQPGSTYGTKIINALNADVSKMNQDLGYYSNYLNAWNWSYAGPVNGAGYDIALVLDLSGGFTDYHWYRKDGNNNGRWSHKIGNQIIRETDASNNYIYNPQTANRNYLSVGGANYTTYVTSFRIYRYGMW